MYEKLTIKKPFYETMFLFIKYLDYLYCNLSGLHLRIEKCNRFYIYIQDDATRAYYAELIKNSNQALETFRKFICQAKR